MTLSRRFLMAAVFWAALAAFVFGDAVRGLPNHDRFDEPAPWALGSGKNDAAKGAHCTAAPVKAPDKK